MAETLPTVSMAGQSRVDLSFLESSVNGAGFTSKSPFNSGPDSELAYADGTGALQAKKHHIGHVLLTPASGTFDLNMATMTDDFGNVINPSKIRLMYIVNRADVGGGNLLIGGAASNPWVGPWANSGAPTTVKLTCEPDSEVLLTAPRTGFTVSATSKTLRFTHGGGSSGAIPFDIYLLCI